VNGDINRLSLDSERAFRLMTCESKTKGGAYVNPLTMNPASWRKSSYSGGEGGNCIEVRSTVDAVRDSKRPGWCRGLGVLLARPH
jgi:hypothetical protein